MKAIKNPRDVYLIDLKKLSFLTYTNQINNGNIFIAPATPIKKKVISILYESNNLTVGKISRLFQ